MLGKILSDEKRDKKTIYKVIGVLALGVMLLIISSMFKDIGQPIVDEGLVNYERKDPNLPNDNKEKEVIESYEVQMEKRLVEILQKMYGVGDVEVMVTTTYGREIILAEDITSSSSSTSEEDTEGGSRKVTSYDDQSKVVMKNDHSSTGNEPIVIKEKQPEIQGVLVIAQGAGNSSVKQSITEAAQTLLGIPAHRVTVHQLQTLKNNKGE